MSIKASKHDLAMEVLAERFASDDLKAEIARLRAALEKATASLAVAANHAGKSHPGLADKDNLASVRAFCLESFHAARAALAGKGEKA